MTEEEQLLILNCMMYSPGFAKFKAEADEKGKVVSVHDWAEWASDESNGVIGDVTTPTTKNGGINPSEYGQVVETVLNNQDTFDGMVIQDVTVATGATDNNQRLMATVTTEDSTIIVYKGTSTPYDWDDNGLGGDIGVTGTPSQREGLDYYNMMRGQFPSGEVYVTGHSKGGNIASYVTVTSANGPFPVTESHSFDGQGFNPAFFAQFPWASTMGNINTHANAADFVNILFQLTGNVTYYQQPEPGYTGGDFFVNHSPFAMLEWDEATGQLKMRPESEQTPVMSMAGGLVSHLQKFMSRDNFETLCQMAMGLAQEGDGKLDFFTDVLVTTDKGELAKLIAKALATGDISALFHERYADMFQELFGLLGGYVDAYGIDPAAIFQLLGILSPDMEGFTQFLAGNGGTLLVKGIAARAPDGNYSVVVRDFSDAVLQQLFGIVDEVEAEPFWDVTKWDIWYRIGSLVGDIDFPADSSKLNEYYRKMIDMKGMSREKIEQIFAKVAEEEHRYAVDMQGIRGKADGILALLNNITLSR